MIKSRMLPGALALLLATNASVGAAQNAPPPVPTLKTRWAAQVSQELPLPEYPRPQMVRAAWVNLNGQWDYAVRDSGAGQPETFDGKILVPFAIESQLSGVRKPVTDSQRLWYRRTFQAPALRKGGRLLLHFGAVDWEAVVYLNGQKVGEHRGGFDPFSIDITGALKPKGPQTLVVKVWDPTDRGPQPRGKQVQKPEGIWYTSVTGIWQTVWLEPVPKASITGLSLVPDIDAKTIRVGVTAAGTGPDEKAKVTIYDGSNPVARAETRLTEDLTIAIPEPKLWSPESPFLYSVVVKLASGDSVVSYTGMRKISLMRDSAGHQRLTLNNRIVFQFGPLDQGWWPDGLLTAPTDEALRSDIEQTKKLGFNMIRKHVKVEPARWYHHADKLGILVWQDMPSANNDTPDGTVIFDRELKRLVENLRNVPSIVVWVPFNEGWGQHDTKRYDRWLEAIDPTRLIDNPSGWVDERVGDIFDVHAYPGPGIPGPDSTRARVLGEYGGLGLPMPGHLWVEQNNWGYQSFANAEELGKRYQELVGQLRILISQGLAAAIYTQTTDVEMEVNGLLTYDREIVKLPATAIAANQLVHRPTPVIRPVIPTSRDSAQRWRYRMTKPDSGWTEIGFDDREWDEGLGGFGLPVPNGYARVPGPIGTPWNSHDIWIRRTVELPAQSLVNPHLRISLTGTAEVYLNGELLQSFPSGTADYKYIPLTDAAIKALRAGPNTIAVHVRGRRGWPISLQYIDVGIDEIIEPAGGK